MSSIISMLFSLKDALGFLVFLSISLLSRILLAIFFSVSLPNGMTFNFPPLLRTLMGRGLAPHTGVLTVNALLGDKPFIRSLPHLCFGIIAQIITATAVFWILLTFLPQLGVLEGKLETVATILPSLPSRSDDELTALLLTDFVTEFLASAYLMWVLYAGPHLLTSFGMNPMLLPVMIMPGMRLLDRTGPGLNVGMLLGLWSAVWCVDHYPFMILPLNNTSSSVVQKTTTEQRNEVVEERVASLLREEGQLSTRIWPIKRVLLVYGVAPLLGAVMGAYLCRAFPFEGKREEGRKGERGLKEEEDVEERDTDDEKNNLKKEAQNNGDHLRRRRKGMKKKTKKVVAS